MLLVAVIAANAHTRIFRQTVLQACPILGAATRSRQPQHPSSVNVWQVTFSDNLALLKRFRGENLTRIRCIRSPFAVGEQSEKTLAVFYAPSPSVAWPASRFHRTLKGLRICHRGGTCRLKCNFRGNSSSVAYSPVESQQVASAAAVVAHRLSPSNNERSAAVESKQPVHVVRFGLIKCCVWRHAASKKTGERHNISVTRLYRDGDVWRESHYFDRDSALTLCKAIDLAHTWIFQHGQGEERNGQ